MTDVKLALYDQGDGRSLYWFSPVSTIQGIRVIPEDLTIKAVQAYMENAHHDSVEVPAELIGRTCRDLLHYMLSFAPLRIYNFEVVFHEGVRFSNHDDFEATFDVHEETPTAPLLDRLAQELGLSMDLFRSMTSQRGHYCLLNGDGRVVAAYPTFDDYLKANP